MIRATFCLALCLVLHLFVKSTDAAVPRESRDAVLVVELAEHAIPKYRWFYRLVEAFAVQTTYWKLRGVYHNVHVVAGNRATLLDLTATLNTLNDRPNVKAIDMLVQLHGMPNRIVFYEGAYAMKDVRARFLHEKSTSKLRALYSGACYGDSHAKDWLGAGFDVASGSLEVNTNGAYDYPTFLGAWRRGYSFSEAQTRGNKPFWIRFYDRIAMKMGFGPANSFKNVYGNRGTTLNSDPAPKRSERYPLHFDTAERAPEFGVPVEIEGKPDDGVSRWTRLVPDRDGIVTLNDAAIEKIRLTADEERTLRQIYPDLQD